MAEVMAGFLCGFGLALIATPAAAIAIVRARVTSSLMAQVVPKETSLVAVTVVIHMFAILTLTAIGLFLLIITVVKFHPILLLIFYFWRVHRLLWWIY